MASILIVDYAPEIRDLFKEILEINGYSVLEATDAAQGLVILAENREIELVITDLEMPGIDGFEFGRRIRAAYPGKKMILVITLGGSHEVAERAINGIGFSAVVVKPVRANVFIGIVERVLAAK